MSREEKYDFEIHEARDGSHTFIEGGKKVDSLSPLERDKDWMMSFHKVRQHVSKEHIYKNCFLCLGEPVINSHVIKEEVLKTLAIDDNRKYRKLLTLNPNSMKDISVLQEDSESVSHKKAFTFKLICNDCDNIFSYEKKSKSKEKYSNEDLESIALKIRLKELYDIREKLSLKSFEPANEFDYLATMIVQQDDNLVQLAIDEENEIRKIYEGEKEYQIFVDRIVNFRIPFASEIFLAPTIYPISNSIIRKNTEEYLGKSDMSSLYVLMEPSGNLQDNWSRVTVFYEKGDREIRQWLNEAIPNRRSNIPLINELISYHISKLTKNFVISPEANPKLIKKLHSFRYSPPADLHNIKTNWVKLFKS